MAVRAYIRFTNIDISQYSLINNAYVEFTAYSDLTGELDTTVYVYDQINPSVPTDKSSLDAISVSAGKAWNITENWTAGETYNSPSISAGIQELINNDNWTAGNSIMVIIENENTGGITNKRDFTSFEYNNVGAKLIIESSDPIVASPPTFTESDGLVTIQSDVSGNIYYTLNGNDPTENSKLYTTSIPITATETLKAKFFPDVGGYIESDIREYDTTLDCSKCDSGWDTDVSAETVARSNSVTVSISADNKCGIYEWAVAGTGYTLENNETYGKTNTLVADGTACGTAKITVTDTCGNTIEGHVKCTTGSWDSCGSTMTGGCTPVDPNYQYFYMTPTCRFGYKCSTLSYKGHTSKSISGACGDGCTDYAGGTWTEYASNYCASGRFCVSKMEGWIC